MHINPNYLTECDAEAALVGIGFKRESDCLIWKHQDLTILAGIWVDSTWMLHVQRVTLRSMTDFKWQLPATGIRGWYCAEIYKIWRDEFKTASVPDALVPGLEFIKYQGVIKRLVQRNPSIHIERPWMRLLINQYRELVETVVLDPQVDFPITLWLERNQLILGLDGYTLRAPATGDWVGKISLSGRVMLNATRRFNRDPVILDYADGKLRLGNRAIQATWADHEGEQTN